jgi:signal transduction histidine kinase
MTQTSQDCAQPDLENQRLKALVELSRTLAESQTGLTEKLQTCVEVLAGLTRAERASLMLVEEDSLVVRAATQPELVGLKTPLEQHSISTAAANSLTPVFTQEVESSAYSMVSRDGGISSYRTGSLISLPLLDDQRLVGVLNLSDKKDSQHFTQDDLDLARGIIGQLAGQVSFSALHSRLNRAYRDLEDSQRIKQDLMYMVFHDMKAPLTGVKEILKLISGNGLSSTDKNQMLAFAQGDLELLWRRITNLLDLSRMESGGFPTNPVDLELSDLAGEAAARLKGLCLASGVELSLDLETQAPLRQDEDLVERLLVNLLANAVQHSSPEQGGGGWVKLEVARREGWALASIWDSGPGVPDELGEAIFQRYTQGSHTKGSTGIGLYFCRQASRLMGGDVSYENQAGGGACFTIKLPLLKGAPVPHAR